MGTATSKKQKGKGSKADAAAGGKGDADGSALQQSSGNETVNTTVTTHPEPQRSAEAEAAATEAETDTAETALAAATEKTVVTTTPTQADADGEGGVAVGDPEANPNPGEHGGAVSADQLNKTKMPEKRDAFSLGARTVYVRYRADNPYAHADFGALLHTTSEGHVLTDLDGTGLARQVDIMENDVIISINNTQTSMVKVSQAAILESLAYIGPKMSLVVKRRCRHGTVFWCFSFQLGEKDNRPVVIDLYKVFLGYGIVFPILTLTCPEGFKYPFCAVYEYKYDYSDPSSIILESDDRHMRIQYSDADFITNEYLLRMLKYEYVTPNPGAPLPIAIAKRIVMRRKCGCPCQDDEECDHDHTDVDVGVERRDDDESKDVCVSGTAPGRLNVEDLPDYMTGDAPISQNAMFFFLSQMDNNLSKITNTDSLNLGMADDGSYGAVLTSELTPLRVTF